MTEQNFDQMRAAMVASQLRTTGVDDPRVLGAMAAVPRERFVPGDRRALAYADVATPLGQGRAMAAPAVLGRLLTEARVRIGEHVLVIGAGPGYSAAVLAALGCDVIALETADGPGAEAHPAGVTAVSGALDAGWPASAPYSLILFDGAIELVPQAIVDQLAEGGRIAAPLIERGVSRLAIGIKAAGVIGWRRIIEAAAPALPGFAAPATFRF
ncbi:protein-L-isoaspartate(D-aspartate) O-methyltransferase [Sphingomonas vulcanisoli]|uniref:Protein-L-isoaspartate O-methyltransferase n=1 Tax=Sphingomonas vulcanisoli TaxID=1658060 RepID=A0ABX0TS13_9SPHN|nr:protein-L-isoaspartate(D-aspartate) O-methyltransferase [Sphingomonas vulcanisoli]